MTELPIVHERARRWPVRLAVLGSFVAAVGALVVVVLTTLHLGPGTTTDPTGPLHVRRVGDLTTPVQSAAGVAVPSGNGILVIGGIEQSGSTVAGVQEFDGSKATTIGTLPAGVRSGAVVTLGSSAYLFGGVGGPDGGAAILGLSSAGRAKATEVAALPRPISDAAAASLDETAFLFGGFSATQPTATVFAWQPGGRPHATAHLPFRLFYDAAATVGGVVIIAGGIVNGAPTRSILSFDPVAHRVTTIGQLPVALAHAAAGVIGGEVFVVGGRGSRPNSQTRAIYRIDPDTGGASYAGALPVGLSDLAIASTGGKLLVAGGVDRSGKVQRAVYELSTS
jgi:N-acetylneuraminic acid mutarotase